MKQQKMKSKKNKKKKKVTDTGIPDSKRFLVREIYKVRNIADSIIIFIKRNLKKILCYIILFTAILVFWAIYRNRDNYKIQNIVQRPSTKESGKNFSKEIRTTRIFVEKYINAYQDVIEEEITPDFKGSFALAKGKSLSALVIFSSASEAYLEIYPSTQNELIVGCTKYPIQIALFSGLDREGSGISVTGSYEDFLKDYNNLKGMFSIGTSAAPMFYSNFSSTSFFPKYFSFSKNSLVSLVNSTIEIKSSDGKEIPKTALGPVGIITGEKDFAFAIERAEELGRSLAESNIKKMFVDSQSFKEALLDEHLSIKAKEINERVSKAEKDSKFKYPLGMFKKDVAELKEEAKACGLDAAYIDELRNYPANQPKDGFLLWYYSNHFGFSVQWTVINTCLLFMFITIVIFERKNNKIAVLMNKWWPKLSLNAILISINAWAFMEKPKYMNMKYWIIPGVLLIACFILTLLKTDRLRQKD